MRNLKPEISLEPDGENFILRVEATDGPTQVVSLTAEQVLSLSQSAPSYRQDILSRLHAGALFASPLRGVGAGWDGFGKAILLDLKLSPSGNVIFDGLRRLLADGPASPLTRQ